MPRPGGLAVQKAISMDGFVRPVKPVPAELRPRQLSNKPASQHKQGPSVAVLARRVPIDMDLPGDNSQWRPVKAGRWRHKRRLVSRGLAVAVVLIITLGGLLFSQSYLKLHKVFKGGSETAAALTENVKPELLKGEGRGRVNVLLLGRGGGNHDAPDLTDTIMLASIDPLNQIGRAHV